MCASFPFVFEGGMWDLNALDPDYCLSFYFAQEHIKAHLLGNPKPYLRVTRAVGD